MRIGMISDFEIFCFAFPPLIPAWGVIHRRSTTRSPSVNCGVVTTMYAPHVDRATLKARARVSPACLHRNSRRRRAVVASSSSASDAAADPLPAPHGNKVVFTTTAHPIKVSVNAHVASAATSVPTPKATPPPAWVYSCLWAGYIIPFVMLTFLPFWRATRWVARSYWALLPLGAIYLYLMPLAWEPGTLRLLLPGSLEVGLESLRLGQWNPQFIPNLDGIMCVNLCLCCCSFLLWIRRRRLTYTHTRAHE